MRSRHAGFSLVEIAISLGILLALLLGLGQTFTASSGLANESYAKLRASEELQRSLDVIANELRGAAATTLTGFDVNLIATSPSWKCVTGLDAAGAPVYGPTKTIEWQTASTPSPGRLVLVCNGDTTTLATRVPSAAFRAILQGKTLKLYLSTLYSTSEGVSVSAAAEASVCLRN